MLIIAAVLLISVFFAFNQPADVDEDISMVWTEEGTIIPDSVPVIVHVVPSEDEIVPESPDETKRSLLWDKDFVFPVDDKMWFTRTLGCIDIVHKGEFKGRKFPELKEICQKVLDENDARENDHKSEENRREIKEFLDTFKGIK